MSIALGKGDYVGGGVPVSGTGDDYRSVVSDYRYIGASCLKADLDYAVYSVRFSPP